MNRESAEKIAVALRPTIFLATNVWVDIQEMADIIERACGQGADSEKVGNNFLTPKLKALDLYYAQKDGCPNGHPSGAGKICVDCVAQALAERSCEHDGIESVPLMFYRHIDRFGVDPKDRTEQSQSQVRCFDAYWKLKTEERSCGETAWVSVSERLPEAQKAIDEYPLLGMVEGWSRPMKVWYFGPDIKWRAEGIYGDPPNVTHWQPLPSPPTGRTNAEEEGR